MGRAGCLDAWVWGVFLWGFSHGAGGFDSVKIGEGFYGSFLLRELGILRILGLYR